MLLPCPFLLLSHTNFSSSSSSRNSSNISSSSSSRSSIISSSSSSCSSSIRSSSISSSSSSSSSSIISSSSCYCSTCSSSSSSCSNCSSSSSRSSIISSSSCSRSSIIIISSSSSNIIIISSSSSSNNNNVAIPRDRNVIKKEAVKVLKYKDLIIEIQRMWIVKAKVIPVVIGANGTISKSLRQYLNNIPGNHEIKELQKRQPFTTESASVKVQNIFHGRNNITCSTTCKNRTVATLYNPETGT